MNALGAVGLDDVLHPAKLKIVLFELTQAAEAHVHADLRDRKLHIFQKPDQRHGHVSHGLNVGS